MTPRDLDSERIISADFRSFEAAYDELLPEFMALRPEKLVPVRIDVLSAIVTVFGVVPKIQEFMPRILDELPRLDVARVKKLDEYAQATTHAQTKYLAALRREHDLQRLAEEGTALRSMLFGDASTLTRHGLLPGSSLKAVKRLEGYKNLASDLQVLAVLFRDRFEQLEGRCATTLNDLDRADAISCEILRFAGTRRKPSASFKAARDMRNRAFTCLHEAYDDARRAISYLRWKERDLDSIAPSLYTGRGGRGKRARELPISAIPPDPPNPSAEVGGPFMPDPA